MQHTTARPASIRISAKLNGELLTHAKESGINKDTLARRAIANMLEDVEDLRDAKASKAAGGKSISMAQLKAQIDLGN